MIFYFLKEGQDEIGPLTLDQLKCSTIRKDSAVWFAGLDEWTTAEDIYELKELFTAKPKRSRFSDNKLLKIWKRFFNKKPTSKKYKMQFNKASKNLN